MGATNPHQPQSLVRCATCPHDSDVAFNVLASLETNGYAIVPECLQASDIDAFATAIDERLRHTNDVAVRRRTEVFAVRNLIDVVPEIRAAFAIPRVRTLLTAALGPQPQLARSILFDKTASANWHVAWHQDLSIAVRRKAETAAYGPWSTKAGVSHVQPPQEILDRMVTLRLHLDTCDATQGVLRVLSGSHRHGRLTDAQIREYAARSYSPATCSVAAGTAVLMKPLLVHASSAAARATRRRVLHFEFSPDQLPGELEWLYGPIWT